MMIQTFKFNLFQENTYLLYDDSGDCLIIDPGCSDSNEENELDQFIIEHQLKVKQLINTHCHIDHVLGNNYVSQKYGVLPEAHKGEEPVLQMCIMVSQMYGMSYNTSPPIHRFLDDGDIIECGGFSLKVFFTPGHSPASISLYNEKEKILIGGDVLFRESIGRTDLPGGNFDNLIKSIKEKLFVLDEDVVVYSGHGPSTTIGHEKRYNPFLK